MMTEGKRGRASAWILGASFLAMFAVAGLWLTNSRGMAQGPASGVRLYVFDMGTLKMGNPQVLLDKGVMSTDMSVESFLIVHPRGKLLFDTGVVPDEHIKPEGTWDGLATEGRATSTRTLIGQLAEIGYKPSDIDYLALSHNHNDHSANANEFAGSTWIVQKAERDVMFPEKPPARANAAAPFFSALKNSKTKLLNNENYDVFGDGTVIIVSTPGHTPGHQSLFVKLAKTGPVVLSGDLYHFPVELTFKDFNPYGGKTSDAEMASREKLQAFMKEHGATLWIGHDMIRALQLKKSPAYYD